MTVATRTRRIGVISDTHCPDRCLFYPASLGEALEGVDLILHAGDVGELWVLDALSGIAPVVAVHGNDDSADAQRELPYKQITTVNGIRLLLCHGHEQDHEREMATRRIDAWEPKLDWLAAMGRSAEAQILVYGHTHIPMVLEHHGITLLNPGGIASGSAFSRQIIRTVARLTIGPSGDASIRHVDLSAPEHPYDPGFDPARGFAAAASLHEETILSPDLRKLLPRLQDLTFDNLDAVKKCFCRLSHECWAGRKDLILARDVVQAFSEDSNLSEADRRTTLAALNE